MGKFLIVFCAYFVIIGSANAALIDRGGGLIYEDDLNITWLANANLADSETFGVAPIYGGNMTWGAAQSWISELNASNYLGFSDWRLPTMFNTDATCESDGPGFYRYTCKGNETGSELGHLFYNELGGSMTADIADVHNGNFSLFQNIVSYKYWTDTGTLYGWCANGYCYPYAWDFDFHTGWHGQNIKSNYAYVWAVRDGDVAAIPEPKPYVLMLAALAMISLVMWSRSQRKISLFLTTICFVTPSYAMPPQCNIRNFPDHWIEAQEQLDVLKSILKTAEASNPYSKASAKVFRQSLNLCEAKRKSIWDESHGTGSGGTRGQMLCEAILVCSRLATLEMEF